MRNARVLLEAIATQELRRLLRSISLSGGMDDVRAAERMVDRLGGKSSDVRLLSTALFRGMARDNDVHEYVKSLYRKLIARHTSDVADIVRRSYNGVLPTAGTQPHISWMFGRSKTLFRVRVTPRIKDVRNPSTYDALEIDIRLPGKNEGVDGLKVVYRVEVTKAREIGRNAIGRMRTEPVMVSRQNVITWQNLYDWRSLLWREIAGNGPMWMRDAYAEASAEASHVAAGGLSEARTRRIRRRLRSGKRRFYGRAVAGERVGTRLPKTAQQPRRFVRPRVIATDPSDADELHQWAQYYRRNRARLSSRAKQLRAMPWYKNYQKQLRRVALAKGTRTR